MANEKSLQLEKKWRRLRDQWSQLHRQSGNKSKLDNLAIEINKTWRQIEIIGKSGLPNFV